MFRLAKAARRREISKARRQFDEAILNASTPSMRDEMACAAQRSARS